MFSSCPSILECMHASMRPYVHPEKFVSTISYKPVDGISLKFGCW